MAIAAVIGTILVIVMVVIFVKLLRKAVRNTDGSKSEQMLKGTLTYGIILMAFGIGIFALSFGLSR